MSEKETMIIGAGIILGLVLLSKKAATVPGPPPPGEIIDAEITCE